MYWGLFRVFISFPGNELIVKKSDLLWGGSSLHLLYYPFTNYFSTLCDCRGEFQLHFVWGSFVSQRHLLWFNHLTNQPKIVEVLTFRWNYLWHGFGSSGFHMTNAVMHGLCSLHLGFFALRVLQLSIWWAGLLAALFMVHPVHTESICYVPHCSRSFEL